MARLGRSQTPRWCRCRLSTSYSSNLRYGVGSREHSWWHASCLLLLEPYWRFPCPINPVYLQTDLRGVRVEDTCPYTVSREWWVLCGRLMGPFRWGFLGIMLPIFLWLPETPCKSSILFSYLNLTAHLEISVLCRTRASRPGKSRSSPGEW